MSINFNNINSINSFNELFNKNLNNIEKYNPGTYNNKEVCQYTLNGTYIKTYTSITMAEKETGATKIGMVCAGKRKTSGGFIWKYK